MLEITEKDPLALYAQWLDAAEASEPQDPSAAALATVSGAGRPSVRMVLVRGRDATAVHFFTNYTSRKAAEIEATGVAALCFHWKSLDRQIRMVGGITRLDAAASDAYYASRPYGSRIAAWASRQSKPVDSRAALDAGFAAAEKEYPDEPPRPPFWGGYRLEPDEMEFWEQGDYRLHDRFRFVKGADAIWQMARLYP